MSIEQSLESIAISLEKLANPVTTVIPQDSALTSATGAAPTGAAKATPGAPDMLPASTKKDKKKKTTPTPPPAANPVPPKAEVSKEDVTNTLQSFLKKFPGPDGAEKAREFFTAVGAKNITTLAPEKYKEVFLGLQAAMA